MKIKIKYINIIIDPGNEEYFGLSNKLYFLT